MLNDFLILMKQELLLTVIIFLLLFIKIGSGMRNEKLLPLMQLLLLLNFLAGFFFNREGSLFDGMYRTSGLLVLQKNILNLAVYLVSLLFSHCLKKSIHLAEYFILMLSALLGMFLMISSGNMLIFYLSLELATIPVAAMANFDLERKRSSEAAMKMILSSAFSSGILLFAISLLYGVTGTISFSGLPAVLQSNNLTIMLFIFLFTAFAFKLSIVPFHLWTADVYEGAPVSTTAFLSVVSKGAVAFIFMTVLYKVFEPMQQLWYHMLLILAIATMIIGNLFALRQQNIKRFLAFSSIAQVGFILVGICGGIKEGTASVVYFVLVYVFSNLAAFGVTAAIADATGKENISDYKGMYASNPFLSWILTLAMFSLAGIPPTAGFFGKLFLLTSGATTGDYWFIIVAALNMIISLFYYLKVVRMIFMEKNDQPLPAVDAPLPVKLALGICAAGIILLGFLSWVYDYITQLV